MGDHSKIEWTDATWNPIRGCARVSEGCRNCYAERVAARFSGPGEPYEGLANFRSTVDRQGNPRAVANWTGAVRVVNDKLDLPLRWAKPRRIFVNSMSDLFYERLPDVLIDEIFAIMALADQHTFQVLTKRVQRMREYSKSHNSTKPSHDLVARVATRAAMRANRLGEDTSSPYFDAWLKSWPLKHIWLGASAENQDTYDERRRDLENTNAAVLWWSLEPLLGPIRMNFHEAARKPDWVVVGGESGRGARITHPDWVRRLRDDCARFQVPFFFKQWGEWAALDQVPATTALHVPVANIGPLMVFRIGKHAAGRKLDGKEWSEYPCQSRN